MYTLPFSGIPTATLDMTADFAPLFSGMWVVLGLSVLGLVVATWWARRKAQQATAEAASLPKAA